MTHLEDSAQWVRDILLSIGADTKDPVNVANVTAMVEMIYDIGYNYGRYEEAREP